MLSERNDLLSKLNSFSKAYAMLISTSHDCTYLSDSDVLRQSPNNIFCYLSAVKLAVHAINGMIDKYRLPFDKYRGYFDVGMLADGTFIFADDAISLKRSYSNPDEAQAWDFEPFFSEYVAYGEKLINTHTDYFLSYRIPLSYTLFDDTLGDEPDFVMTDGTVSSNYLRNSNDLQMLYDTFLASYLDDTIDTTDKNLLLNILSGICDYEDDYFTLEFHKNLVLPRFLGWYEKEEAKLNDNTLRTFYSYASDIPSPCVLSIAGYDFEFTTKKARYCGSLCGTSCDYSDTLCEENRNLLSYIYEWVISDSILKLNETYHFL